MAKLIASDSYYEARLLSCLPVDSSEESQDMQQQWMMTHEWKLVQDEEGETIAASTYADCLAAALPFVEEEERKYLVIAQVDVTYFVE